MSRPARAARQLAAAASLGLALAASSCRSHPSATIVVDVGPYRSAEAAGHDEARVCWTDQDPRDDVRCTSCFAACELQHYLRLTTGERSGFAIADDDSLPDGDLILIGGPDLNRITARFSRVLGVGPAELARCGAEGYVIRSAHAGGRRVFAIAGGGRVGTLYGAYDFLHRIGVRWYAPGPLHERVPSRPWRQVPDLSVRESPTFRTRGFHAWEDRGNEAFFLWMARNRLDYWCVEQHEHPLLHKLGIKMAGGGHGLSALFLDPHAEYPYRLAGFPERSTRPPDPYPISSEFQGDANHDGRLSNFEAHPEWFALRGGKRSDRVSGDTGDNFCTSNPDAMSEWMKHAIADLASGPDREADVLNAWLLDGGRWCTCARCRALGTPTDRNLLFVNRLAREVRKARAVGLIRRPVTLFFLAYADVAAPPTRPLPPDFDYDHCVATFFPITRCYAHRFDDPSCDVNARYEELLRGWATRPERYYRGRVCLGEYYNVSGYKSLPLCLMHTMERDLPHYAALGIRDFHYMHCTTRDWGPAALTNWQMARQLWSPGTSCAALWDDYFAGRYGAAAGPMRRFYEELETMFANVTEVKYGLARRLDAGIEPLFTGDHLRYAGRGHSLDQSLRSGAACRRILDQVLEGSLPDLVRGRVAEDGRRFTYGERTLRLYGALCRASFALEQRKCVSAAEDLREARRLAEALQGDTLSTRFSSSHANASDALAASGVATVLARLDSALAREEESEAPELDPTRAGLVLEARALEGGGALSFGEALLADFESAAGSAACVCAFGRGTAPCDRLGARFRCARLPGRDLTLRVTGFARARSSSAAVRGAVVLNGFPVAAGELPLPRNGGTFDVALPAALIERGVNRVEIRNLEPGGVAGRSPWIGVERLELRAAPPRASEPLLQWRGPQDLDLTFRSVVDGSEQPYRIYLPSAYDGKTRSPVLVLLHGTNGSQDSFFDDSTYGDGSFEREAEKRGVVLVCPNGRGTAEYRGVGETDVLEVVDHVQRGFCVDPDRIVCCGHSMGGTGTTYLAMRHADLFAGGIALSSAYEHVGMVENLRGVPMLFVQGAWDWPVYAAEGPMPITARLNALGYPTELWTIPKARHNVMRSCASRVMDWALRQRRERNPRRVTFKAYFPGQGRAYWTEIREIEEPGYLAEIDARVEGGNRIEVRVTNAGRLALRPPAELLDLARPISVVLNGARVFSNRYRAQEAIVCARRGGRWLARCEPAGEPVTVPYHACRIGWAYAPPTQRGEAETSMGDWMCDMMRSVSGADIAIYNRRDYRGEILTRGQEVYMEDLYDWIRPYDRPICTFRCTGRELREILEANLLDGPAGLESLVQVSGCRYAFDRRQPAGRRIVFTSLDSARTYTVACEGQVLSRETVRLGGRWGKIPFVELEPSAVSGAWAFIAQLGGRIEASLDGRVRDLTALPPAAAPLAATRE